MIASCLLFSGFEGFIVQCFGHSRKGDDGLYNYADGHCDSIVRQFERNQELLKNDGHIDLERLENFDAPLQFFALWLEPMYYPIAMRQTMKYIDFFESQLEKNKGRIGLIREYEDILENKRAKKMSAILAIEGGEALEGEISAIRTYYRLGVRAMTLTWNHRNALADGVAEEVSGGGLTKFGRKAVKEMERLGMLVDVSHLAQAGFWDVVKLAQRPFIASHSNAREICNVPRNLWDNQLRAVARSGGVVGINLYGPFLAKGRAAETEDILRHIAHMISVMGEDSIALGTDFDGIDQMPIGMKDILDMEKVFVCIEKEFGQEAAKKIFSDNLLRVLKEVLHA